MQSRPIESVGVWSVGRQSRGGSLQRERKAMARDSDGQIQGILDEICEVGPPIFAAMQFPRIVPKK